MKRQRAIIIIDGSNFYHKLKDLKITNLSLFNYNQLIASISKDTQIIEKYFCIGKIKAKQEDKKGRKMMAHQQSLVTRLQKEGFTIQFGFLLKTDRQYHEKGVDIQIAVNLLKGAYRNTYDIAYLISSDSDLIPAITEAQSLNKTIVYVGFRYKISLALLRVCKKAILLDKKDLIFEK